jgi:hypothetical protein
MNVHHLILKDCRNRSTTRGLHNDRYESITGSITFIKCYDISLVGLQGIPEVHIRACLRIKSFGGLGNHQLLSADEVTPLFDMYNEFLAPGAHNEIFENIHSVSISPVVSRGSCIKGHQNVRLFSNSFSVIFKFKK